MNNVATPFAQSKGKFVYLDEIGNEVQAGSADAVTVRVEGMELARNGSFRVVATYRHPNPPPPERRRCKTRNGQLPEANPRPDSSDDDEAVAGEDSERIEPGLDPPPSAEIIASTHDALTRRTQTLRDQGRNLAQLIEPPHGVFLTAWPELHYHSSRRAEVERAFNSPKTSEHPSEDEIALQFVASIGARARYVSLWGKWFVWRDSFWEPEETLAILDFAREKCREMGARRQRFVQAVEVLASAV